MDKYKEVHIHFGNHHRWMADPQEVLRYPTDWYFYKWGDSGGPLVAPKDNKWTVYGLVSWGPLVCGIKQEPTVYMRVSGFRQWMIINHIFKQKVTELYKPV
ncbi:putative inactive serine protease 43 [Tachypleus tridentatus]|uniref:putative inactive serine protease 43 n=1 Tax=Tachypleus tridentatus TaxID=6853 RepID=UPI003FD35B07